jgi:hypothetical protein
VLGRDIGRCPQLGCMNDSEREPPVDLGSVHPRASLHRHVQVTAAFPQHGNLFILLTMHTLHGRALPPPLHHIEVCHRCNGF